MKIILDYFDDDFRISGNPAMNVRPFDHAEITVNCDQPRCRINGPLEREVETFLNKVISPVGLKARWDKSQEVYYSQPSMRHEFPRINKLIMGVDFDLDK